MKTQISARPTTSGRIVPFHAAMALVGFDMSYMKGPVSLSGSLPPVFSFLLPRSIAMMRLGILKQKFDQQQRNRSDELSDELDEKN